MSSERARHPDDRPLPAGPWMWLAGDFATSAVIRIAGERASWLLLAIFGQLRVTNSTDGRITRGEIEHLGIRDHRRRLERLIAAGLIEPTEDPNVLRVVDYRRWIRWQRRP